MTPSGARHVARVVCWYKAARTIKEAHWEVAVRLERGDELVQVYRCPFSHPDEPAHFHMSGDGDAPRGNRVQEALAVLGADAYRRASVPALVGSRG